MVIVDNKLPRFKANMIRVFDDAIEEAGRDILNTSRNKAPYKKGGLRGSSFLKRIGLMYQRIYFDVEYARFQEFGGDSRRKVKNYTTAGTQAHYLQESGDYYFKKLIITLKKHSLRIKA